MITQSSDLRAAIRNELIRELFLRDRDYSIDALAELWRVSESEVVHDVMRDEVQIWREAHPTQAVTEFRASARSVRELSVSYNLIRPGEIEQVLGDAFRRVRSPAWRTRAVTLQLPEWLLTITEESPLFLTSHSLEARVEFYLFAFFAQERPETIPPTRT